LGKIDETSVISGQLLILDLFLDGGQGKVGGLKAGWKDLEIRGVHRLAVGRSSMKLDVFSTLIMNEVQLV
jgi:hypothetical protein